MAICGEIDLSRSTGHQVTGRVTRVERFQPARLIAKVCSINASPDTRFLSDKVTTLDAQPCRNGRFETEQLEPGEYMVIGPGYEAWEREQISLSGFPSPRYLGAAKLVVPLDGVPELIEVTLKDRQPDADTP